MNTLVAYFSATGTTEAVAKQIANATNGKLYEIERQTAYTDADLNWQDNNCRANKESKDRTTRPAIKNTSVGNLADYDVVYIGFPIWWYTYPTIIATFIENHDLKGKTIVPFATSGGSTIKHSVEELKKTYPQLNIKDGKILNSPSNKEIEDFVKQ